MQNNKLIILLLSIGVVSLSCKKNFDSQDELFNYIADKDNRYYFSKIVNGVCFELQYKPTDIIIKQEIGDSVKSQLAIKKMRDTYSKYIYFNLKISSKDGEILNGMARDKIRFGKMVNTLAFNMDQKIHMYTRNHDTIPLLDYIYPRMYGMSNSTSILLVYPRKRILSAGKDVSFVIEDLGITTGDVKFQIEIDAIKNEPHLNLN